MNNLESFLVCFLLSMALIVNIHKYKIIQILILIISCVYIIKDAISIYSYRPSY